MLAGLTRGLWTDATADRYLERRGAWADAASRPSPSVSDAATRGIASENRAPGSADTTSDRS